MSCLRNADRLTWPRSCSSAAKLCRSRQIDVEIGPSSRRGRPGRIGVVIIGRRGIGPRVTRQPADNPGRRGSQPPRARKETQARAALVGPPPQVQGDGLSRAPLDGYRRQRLIGLQRQQAQCPVELARFDFIERPRDGTQRCHDSYAPSLVRFW